MCRRAWFQRLTGILLGISAVALVCVVALPGRQFHTDPDAVAATDSLESDDSSGTHGFSLWFSATPPASLVIQPATPFVAAHAFPQRAVARTSLIIRSTASRAPPVLA